MARVDTAFPLLRERHRAANLAALTAILGDVAEDVTARQQAGAKVLLAKRWDAALAAVLLDRNVDTAAEISARVASSLGGDFDPSVMEAWLGRNAEIGSTRILDHARDTLDAAEDDEQVEHELKLLTTSKAALYAASLVTTIAGFAARDAGKHLGARYKTWQVNSADPRSSHAKMRGETVPIEALFSNRMDWPGDPDGGADEVAYCECSLTIVTG